MLRIAAAAAALLTLTASAAGAFDIVTCGEVVTRNDPGILQADLDCSGTGAPAVRLRSGATLELNGHVLIGGPLAPTVTSAGTPADPEAIRPGNFTIRGPGVIAGTAVDMSPFRSGNGCVDLRDGRAVITSDTGTVEIYGCETGVIGGTKGPNHGGRGRLTIDHADVHDNLIDGVYVRKLVASDVSAHHHSLGLSLAAIRGELTDVLVHHSMMGIAIPKLVGTDITAIDNDSPSSANGQGIYTENCTITRLTATGNTNPGIGGVHVKLIDSELSNNGLKPPHTDVDIQTEVAPVLVNTTCLHSEVAISNRPLPPTYPDWGVCSGD